MGMFRDLKKLSDQGKEMGRKSGRPTSMVGMLEDTPNVISQATAAVDDALALQDDLQRQQALLTTGTPARAVVRALQDTGMLVNFNPEVVLDLDVTVEGQVPYITRLAAPIPQVMLAQVQPGKTLDVRVDPSNPSSLAIDWSQPPT